MMKPKQHMVWLVVPLTLAGLAGCDKPPSGQSMGEKVGQTATEVGRTIDQTAKDVERSADKASAAAAATMDDAAVTAKVRALVLSELGMRAIDVGVETKDGVVSLSGAVGTEGDRRRAAELAASIANVKNVENHLVVKSTG